MCLLIVSLLVWVITTSNAPSFPHTMELL
jgi:hypothetical protein